MNLKPKAWFKFALFKMSIPKKKVLITGSNGLLGQKLIDLYLTIPNIQLIATSNGENRHPVKENYLYESMDITSHNRVNEVLKEHVPQTIIHTAAMTNVDACETQQELCMELNVFAVENLAKISHEIGAHLIHLSTDFIFPGTKKLYTEDDIAQPLSFYGNSKWEGEKMVQKFAGSWSILRTVIVYGVVHKMSRSNIVLWAYQALKEGKPMNVVDDQYRTPTLAEDLAMGCRLVEDQSANGIYNICGKDFMSILELVQRVGKHFGLDTTHVKSTDSASLNQAAKRPPITGLNIDKAIKELGYSPRSFEEGLAVVYEQILKETTT